MAKVKAINTQVPEYTKTVTLPADQPIVPEKPLVIQPTEPVAVQNPIINPTSPTYAEQRGLTSGDGSLGTKQVSNAPDYVQENAMANNVTRKPLE